MKSKAELIKMLKSLDEKQSIYFMKMFENIPDDIVKTMNYKKVKKNETLIQTGDICDTVYIILSGRVSGTDYQQSGNIYVFMDFCKMDIVGDFEVFGGMSEYSASIKTVEDSEILTIPAKAYLSWMKQDVNALFSRTQKLMHILFTETKDGRKHLFLSCKDRLILYLVNFYEKHGKDKESCKVKKNQTEIADGIGFHVRSVQRNILTLKEEGLLTVESGKIVISYAQYSKLKEYVDCKYID